MQNPLSWRGADNIELVRVPIPVLQNLTNPNIWKWTYSLEASDPLAHWRQCSTAAPEPQPNPRAATREELSPGGRAQEGQSLFKLRHEASTSLDPVSPFGSYVSWTPLEPGVVAIFVLSICFLSYSVSPSSNSLSTEFWATWNQTGLEFAKLNGLS